MKSQDLHNKFIEWAAALGGRVEYQMSDVPYTVATFETADGKTISAVLGEED